MANPALAYATRVLQVLQKNGFRTMFAGGCVRDALLQDSPHDFDLATSAPPEDIIRVLKAHQIRFLLNGLKHGTVTAVFHEEGAHYFVETTSLRGEKTHDGRHAEVHFGVTFEEDASRRDFTVNALFRDDKGQIHDFVGGLQDLQEKRLRFVGDPFQRIQEDHLRLLRFYRFSSQLGFELEKKARTITKLNAHVITTLSKERITEEFFKLMKGTYATKALQELSEDGVWNVLFEKLLFRNQIFEQPKQPALSPEKYGPSATSWLRYAALVWGSCGGDGLFPHHKAPFLKLSLKTIRWIDTLWEQIGFFQTSFLEPGDLDPYLVETHALSREECGLIRLYDKNEAWEKRSQLSYKDTMLWMQAHFRNNLERCTLPPSSFGLSDFFMAYDFLKDPLFLQIDAYNRNLGPDKVLRGHDLKKEFKSLEPKHYGRILLYLHQTHLVSRWKTKEEGLALTLDFIKAKKLTLLEELGGNGT